MKKVALTAAISAALLSAMPLTAISHEQGDLIIRAGAAMVDPNDDSSTISVQALNGSVAGTGVGVDSDTQLGLTIAYMLTDNWGIELLASTPFEHDLSAKGLGGFGVSEVGTVEHLPPTLSLQYYFDTGNSNLHPYAGVGVNYLLILDESLSSQMKSELSATSMDLDDSVGLSLQAGLDYQVSSNWMINASIWYIQADTSADINSSTVGKIEVDVDIDPWVYMLSAAYKF